MAETTDTVVTLKYPVTIGAITVTELRFRRPKAGDFRAIKDGAGSFAMTLDLAAAISGVAPRFIDELDAEDMPAVMEVVGSFLEKFQPTGKT